MRGEDERRSGGNRREEGERGEGWEKREEIEGERKEKQLAGGEEKVALV